MKKITFFIVFLVFAGIYASGQSYIISTFAGKGVYGVSGDGGPATAAEMEYPWGICADAAGNVYVADYPSARVRKISAAGIITTFAGTGAGGYSGDGGQATAAALDFPCGVYADAAGNVYIGDALNERIRKVTPAGIITTVAGTGVAGFSGDGGQATAAQINYPTGIWGDPAGDLIISDQSNYRVRKVTPAGVISTIAGRGVGGYSGDGGQATAAEFYVSHCCTDAAGNVYIGDWFNNRVRFVNVGTGIITTVAGNGVAAFCCDGGPATAAECTQPGDCGIDAGGNLWIPDGANSSDNRIRIVQAGIIKTVAGNGVAAFCCDGGPATAAEINTPEGICFDPAGNVYIADCYNYRVRKLTVTALPVTLTSFTAEYIQGSANVELNWVTSSEINNKEFIVEKNLGENLWQQVAVVPGAGNSSQTNYYTATDENIVPGTMYYRLKQIDYDGNYMYSNVETVSIPENVGFSIFPNPVSENNLTLKYLATSTGAITIHVMNMIGEESIPSYNISNISSGENTFSINTSTLAKGEYILLITGECQKYSCKFLKL